jgi:methyl-accepting chemotaxis protein
VTRRLRDLRVASKLFAGFSVILVMLLAVAALAAVRLHGAQESLERMHASGLGAVEAMADVKASYLQSAVLLSDYALTLDAGDKALLGRQLTDQDAVLDAAWTRYEATAPATNTEFTEALRANVDAYRAARAELLPLAQGGDVAGFLTERSATTDVRDVEIRSSLDQVLASENRAAGIMADTGAADYRQALLVLVVAAALAVTLAVLLVLAIARSIARPLAKVVDVISGLADGRLDRTVEHDSADEVGQLAVAANRSIDRLRELLREITGSSTELSASAQNLTAVSATLSAGAEESSAQAQLVAAATEEISANISTVAAAGEEMTSAIREIASSTADASATATTAVSAAHEAEGTLARLSDSSKEIGEVVQLITSIAAQTNLLALNATIEAARAGEAGRGFAVVAGEVKELAQQTARATEDITARVGATQADADAAAAAIAQIGEVISRIDDLQATVAAAVEEQSATTAEMVRNVTEVSVGSQEISLNVAGIATAASETTTSATLTAQTATAVSEAAHRLDGLVATFRLT